MSNILFHLLVKLMKLLKSHSWSFVCSNFFLFFFSYQINILLIEVKTFQLLKIVMS